MGFSVRVEKVLTIEGGEIPKKAGEGFEPGSLMANPEFREIHSLFQRLWTASTGQPGYVKKDWQKMDNALVRLARKAGM